MLADGWHWKPFAAKAGLRCGATGGLRSALFRRQRRKSCRQTTWNLPRLSCDGAFFAERANNPFSREIAISQRTIQPCAELRCVGWNTLGQAGLDNCWGLLLRSGQRWITRTLLLAMARDARH